MIAVVCFIVASFALAGCSAWVITGERKDTITDQFKAMLDPSELERARQDFAETLFRDFVAEEKERRKAVEASRRV